MSDPISNGTFRYPVTPELARVLAQAAESAFVPSPFYVVCRYAPGDAIMPFDVQKPVTTYEEAQALATRLGDAVYGVFGPFESSPVLDPITPSQATVAEIMVTPRRGQTMGTPFKIMGTEYDALFYSIEAVSKFLVPYYTQEYGPECGVKLMHEFETASLALIAHLPWSEEVTIPSAVAQGATDPGTDARPRAKTRYIPVVFDSDANGNVQPRRLDPAAMAGK